MKEEKGKGVGGISRASRRRLGQKYSAMGGVEKGRW